jgi:hypothetical protein
MPVIIILKMLTSLPLIQSIMPVMKRFLPGAQAISMAL